jgi:hypothetical protein
MMCVMRARGDHDVGVVGSDQCEDLGLKQALRRD